MDSHSAARLKLEQDQLKEKQEWSEEELVSHFLRWAEHSKVREQICGNCLAPEGKECRMRAIFGLEVKSNTKDDVEVIPGNQSESNQLDP